MSAYEELLDITSDVFSLYLVENLLEWDQEVMLPPGGAYARAKQAGTISKTLHTTLTQPRVGELLHILEQTTLTEEQTSVVRETKRLYERAKNVPSKLAKDIAETTTQATLAWREARENNDYEAFKPHLQRIINLLREQAQAIDPDRDPYEVLFEEYEPCIPLSEARTVLAAVTEEVPKLLPQAKNQEYPFTTATLPDKDVIALCTVLAKDFGFDFNDGRLDLSTHPMTLWPADTRITTRLSDGYVFALAATAHEVGHALYQQGLPLQEHFGTPLAGDRGMTVHESQSRLWENHVFRGLSFNKHFFPLLQQQFPEVLATIDVDDWVSALTHIKPGFIRVDADEVSYPLHIILRFELEQELIRGTLSVDDLPTRWSQRFEELFGMKPPNDTQGVLQDVHWASGNIGYFPTYLLGSALAAQLWNAIKEQHPSVEEELATGDTSTVLEWLRTHVHAHGQRYTTQQLIERATGKGLSAEDYLAHLRHLSRSS